MQTTFDPFIETDVPEGEEIISLTDFMGVITYVNDTFATISGYTPDELIGQSHSLIRHPDMPVSIFADLWETIQSDETWVGYVKNLRKDGGYYWVLARVSTVYKDGEPIGYKSIREPVPHDKKIDMQNLYDRRRTQEEHVTRVVLYVHNDQLDDAKALES